MYIDSGSGKTVSNKGTDTILTDMIWVSDNIALRCTYIQRIDNVKD